MQKTRRPFGAGRRAAVPFLGKAETEATAWGSAGARWGMERKRPAGGAAPFFSVRAGTERSGEPGAGGEGTAGGGERSGGNREEAGEGTAGAAERGRGNRRFGRCPDGIGRWCGAPGRADGKETAVRHLAPSGRPVFGGGRTGQKVARIHSAAGKGRRVSARNITGKYGAMESAALPGAAF